jgi:hypothetical protein
MRPASSTSSSDREWLPGLPGEHAVSLLAKLAVFIAMAVALDSAFLLFKRPDYAGEVASELKLKYYRQMLLDDTAFDLIAIGSSVTQSGFIPAIFARVVGGRAFNAGIAGNVTMQRHFEILEEILRHKRPRGILLGLEGFALAGEVAPANAGSRQKQLFHRSNSFKYRAELTGWLRKAFEPDAALPPLPAFGPDRDLARFPSVQSVTAHPDGFVEFHAHGNPDYRPASLGSNPLPRQVEFLRRFVNLCRERDVELYIVQYPSHASLRRLYPADYETFGTFMTRFSAEAGIAFLDFNTAIAFPESEDMRFYYDNWHLNLEGATAFTTVLATRLRQLR